jgi:PAS domain S-box-containing protein
MFWADQTAILERVAAGAPLGEILKDIIEMIERQAEGMSCSLLLMDDDGVTIRRGAAPTLPVEFMKHLDGLKIGPNAGSCGAAAHRRQRVVVEDISSHPYWEAYRDLALPFGLRACWSTPIFSAERDVLGTFAMYYGECRGPSDAEMAWVDAATHLAAIAIVSDRATKSLRRSEARAKHLARLYAMSSAINEAIVRERDVARLYESACRIAVDHGMARLAWIGLIDESSQTAVPVAHAGVAFERACPIHLNLGPAHMACDPAVESIRKGFPFVCNDIARDPSLYWRDIAVTHALRSCAVFPMRNGGVTAGIFVIYSECVGQFGDEETNVLATLTEDIAFAVESAKTASALRRSEERLRSLIEHTPDVAIQWFNEAGRITFYNQASRRLFGWSEAGALGKSLFDLGFWSSSDELRFGKLREAAAAGGQVAPTQFPFRRVDGSDGFLLSTIFRIPLSDSEYSYVCMDVDLTEHHRMEAAVRAGETLRALIYDCVADVVFYVAVEGDGNYRFHSVNRAFLESTGLREHEVVGRLVDDVIPPSSLVLVKAKYAEAVATQRKVVWEEVSRYPSGVRYGEVTVGPIVDAEGKCTHLVGTVHDVTERRAAESERREIEARLHQTQRLQALGTLAGGIAHDFNNLLLAIHGNVDLLQEMLGAEHGAQEGLLEVKNAAVRATSMVRQILTFSRKDEPQCELLELRPVIEEALSLLSVAIKGGVKLRSDLAQSAPRVYGDSTQVHQTVVNLVTNAVHAIGDAPGVIEVRLDSCVVTPGGRSDAPDLAAGTYARVTVSDDGSGMDPMTLARVFEPFFTTKPSGEGTGLGLSVVHGIMKGHHGAVTVRSELRKGTTFELLFPVPAAEQASAVIPSGAVERPLAQRILFVDEDEAVVFLARRAFSRLGHSISAHSSSAEALSEFKRQPAAYDVLVADMSTVQLDDAALVRELRGIRPDLQIVATTECIRPEDLPIARELGVQILERPQSLDDLATLIAHHVQ